MLLHDWWSAALACHPEPEIGAVEIRALIAHVTGLSATQQRIHNLPLLPSQQQKLNADYDRLLFGEPLAYIVGTQEFWDLTLTVSRATLIPRADTEVLVERALFHAQTLAQPVIYDLGTGSGAIALALAKHLPAATVFASDISRAALTVATENAARYQLSNVQFLLGDWLAPFPPTPADMIVSNPPYIAADDEHLAALRYEPEQALIAARAGYQDLFTLMDQAPQKLRPRGWLLLEHGYQQGETVCQYAAASGHYQNIATHCDWAGRPRFTEMQIARQKA